jgi:hypothetical protein
MSKNGEKTSEQPVTGADADYMFGVIKKICTEVGPGIPCSPQEEQRAMILKEEMEKLVGPENVAVEKAILAPGAVFGWFRWGCLLAVLSVIFFFTRQASGFPLLFAFLAFVCILLVNVTAVFEFFLMGEFVDFLYKKRESQNVIGTIRRKGQSANDIKRLLIVSGHHDSAIQFNWLTYLGFGYYLALAFIFISLVSLLIGTGAELFSLLLSGKSLPWAQQSMFRASVFVGPLGFISAFFFLGSQKDGGTVPGAADNLSACAVALGVGRVLARHPELIPPGTEVRMITFGAEEAGMRGALRYVEQHREELERLDARVCNLDTIIRPKIVIHTTDGNSFVKNSPEVYNGLVHAARAAGVPHAKMPFPTFGGGTDALPFSRYGIKAASLVAMAVPAQMIRWYHTPRDQYTLYEDEKEGGTRGLSNALKLCVEWIRQMA